ncbi:hypothetical protein WMY93_010256 [Mugilogobius chulae]|uniref:SMP-LTD domain-containing protein n=1 Tax=Mugilogobius chulae TaxID=88201 RepID=A0AAW0PAJ5_9GOBI
MSLFCIGVLSYGYFILPLGSYFSGMAFGVALGFFIGLLLIRLSTTRSHRGGPKPRRSHNMLGEVVLTGSAVRTESDTLKGWMNEVYDYDPLTYHASQSHSVFATLEGSCCAWTPHETTSAVSLLPSVLAQKRQWNPKYPMCLQLCEGAISLEKEAGSDQDSAEQTQTPNPSTLYLFGRTGREKEEWYRHFLLASEEREVDRCVGRSATVHAAPPSSAPAAVVNSRGSSRVGSEEDSSTPLYLPMPRPPTAAEPSHPGASSTATSPTTTTGRGYCTCDAAEYSGKNQTAWINALIGRIFWDFLREKYYADMVSNKIQKKLSTIRLPYFMNELTVTEMDLGTSMPLITATSKPDINPRGLWLELQLVYNGGLQMTLQTKFNLSNWGRKAVKKQSSHRTQTLHGAGQSLTC